MPDMTPKDRDDTLRGMASELVCLIYELRAKRLVAKQIKAFKAGESTQAVELQPPTGMEAQYALNAVGTAYNMGVEAALKPIIRLVDSGLKGNAKDAAEETLTEVRALRIEPSDA